MSKKSSVTVDDTGTFDELFDIDITDLTVETGFLPSPPLAARSLASESSPPSPPVEPSEAKLNEPLLPRSLASETSIPPPSGDASSGKVIGPLILLKRIGMGGFGSVYLAEHASHKALYAVKLLHLQGHIDEEALQQSVARFQREARALAQLKHENVVTITDFGFSEPFYYLAMEYLRGETIAQRLTRQGPFPLAQIEPVLVQICAALDYIHRQGIIHRDIKPSNFLLLPDPSAGREIVKLLDFGVASLADDMQLTQTGVFLGSPSYTSPEQASGLRKELDGRADLYSLTVSLFQMITGKLPFEGKSTLNLIHHHAFLAPPSLADKKPDFPWPSKLEAFFQKALSKDPNDRYPDAPAFLAAFQDASVFSPTDPSVLAVSQKTTPSVPAILENALSPSSSGDDLCDITSTSSPFPSAFEDTPRPLPVFLLSPPLELPPVLPVASPTSTSPILSSAALSSLSPSSLPPRSSHLPTPIRNYPPSNPPSPKSPLLLTTRLPGRPRSSPPVPSPSPSPLLPFFLLFLSVVLLVVAFFFFYSSSPSHSPDPRGLPSPPPPSIPSPSRPPK